MLHIFLITEKFESIIWSLELKIFKIFRRLCTVFLVIILTRHFCNRYIFFCLLRNDFSGSMSPQQLSILSLPRTPSTVDLITPFLRPVRLSRLFLSFFFCLYFFHQLRILKYDYCVTERSLAETLKKNIKIWKLSINRKEQLTEI